jgi:hypothetical protein
MPNRITQRIWFFMFVETAAFSVAALTHFGLLIAGYQHHRAGTAESVITLVLFAGLALSWIRPASIRVIGLAAQGFALLGTLVGIFMIAIGDGPRTLPDVAYHVIIVIVLVSGITVAARTRFDHAEPHT